ncbi:bifunctional DNA-formamidopyrimidine glycosylase/DNA-(apurinic or apyrimidinic site) lyase [Maricaulis sp.]|jgi:formamidopyrimidine-DNA glycosylase|uniref:bifunctional DNA-formamidopyrimidine glycosylase/DNA-(apurinic or apyrimidinic site) lyase n=1 Tax=Maricaulis sp. TaxID=1486257 RepID=UPI0025CE10E7|nr:bifunctional DNA-formamidopyrimidine glycosylase/DNA-(apurinic or apyrimidinic site) lyase [Maricaulis sp.]MDF1767568.1 bifunctional DNA-formamidopyrimidine glycosylase/DNA-(apurinic or apyrimidinic site) lyase [Maricaulis sp.]
MPELPEVETVRRGLIPALEGRRLLAVEVNRPNLRFAFPDRFAERLTGQRVERIDRRAKYLLVRLSGGETMIGHLGMSGRFSIEVDGAAAQPGDFVHAAPANPKHDHVVFRAEGGVVVRYNDPRRFGYMDLFRTAAEADHPVLGALGPEPHGNEFSGPYLSSVLAGRRTPIKAALLDQSIVAGLGNIYVCEALHRSGISPRRAAASIPGVRADRLATAVRAVIIEAIEAGGSSLKDFASTDGALGYFQHRFRVYDRLGAPCPTDGCQGAIQRIVQSGRSTWFCSSCQR